MIEIKNLGFSYEDKAVFTGLDLEIGAGEFVAILGHNGSGKSTLSKLLVGLATPDSGEIFIGGLKSTDDTIAAIREQVSIVFQNPDNQFVGATVVDDIAFGLENRQVPREEMIEIVAKSVTDLGLTGLEDTPPHDLSGGQKQRTAIAGALAVGAKVLILDEATSMLDPAGRRDMMALIGQLASDAHRTIVMITHHLDEAVYADRIVVLNEGRVIKNGAPHAVFDDPIALESVGLDVPFAVKASLVLKEKGIIDQLCITNEELKKALCL